MKKNIFMLVSGLVLGALFIGCTSTKLDVSTLENKTFTLTKVSTLVPYAKEAANPSDNERALGQLSMESLINKIFSKNLLVDSLKDEFNIDLDVSQFMTEENIALYEANQAKYDSLEDEKNFLMDATVLTWNIQNILDDYQVDEGVWAVDDQANQYLRCSITLLLDTVKVSGTLYSANPEKPETPYSTEFSYSYALTDVK